MLTTNSYKVLFLMLETLGKNQFATKQAINQYLQEYISIYKTKLEYIENYQDEKNDFISFMIREINKQEYNSTHKTVYIVYHSNFMIFMKVFGKLQDARNFVEEKRKQDKSVNFCQYEIEID